jgi:hypothetical protein
MRQQQKISIQIEKREIIFVLCVSLGTHKKQRGKRISRSLNVHFVLVHAH